MNNYSLLREPAPIPRRLPKPPRPSQAPAQMAKEEEEKKRKKKKQAK